MGWPTNKAEYIARISELVDRNLRDDIRKEEIQRNRILINAYRNDLRKIQMEEE